MELKNKIFHSDCLIGLKTIPNESVDCCVTSPPYWGLRDYGTATWEGGDKKCSHKRESKKSDKTITGHKNFEEMNGVGDAIYKEICLRCGAKRIDQQLGLETTPESYVSKMVEIFSEVKRVLKKEGTLWLNLGDSYANDKIGNTKTKKNPKVVSNSFRKKRPDNLKPKDLVGIPWMVAFALRSSGWYLRQDIIWYKSNPMPESVTDRCTKAHEYIFLMSKSQKYYYDNEAISEKTTTFDNGVRDRDNSKLNNTPGRTRMMGLKTNSYETRNKRSVWSVSTKAYKEAHFATFPEKLIVDCIKAGCPEKGIILDPFMGAGTTAIVARKLNRNYIGFELNKDYIDIAEKRLIKEIGIFL